MHMFKLMYFLSQAFRRITSFYDCSGLENMFALIKMFVHIMDGDPALFFACGDHSFMNFHPIHALSAIFGKQRRVYINNMIRIGRYQFAGTFHKKTCQNDEIDPVLSLIRAGKYLP
jgi:hypothetical protein